MRRARFWMWGSVVGISGLAATCLAVICLAVAAEDKVAPKSKPLPKNAPPAVSPKPARSDGKNETETAERKGAVVGQTETASVAAIKDSTQHFVAGYNNHDSKAIAACFTLGAVLVTDSGTKMSGRDAIERHFAAVYGAAPQSHLELKAESVHLVTSTVAIEDGNVTFTSAPEMPVENSRYVAVHVFQDGRWLLDRTRDYAAEDAPKSNHERLMELEWLVGEWMEEAEDEFIATSCHWSKDRNYLMEDFTIRVGGMPPVTGSMRIGWDPLTRQIKSWTFDSDGGYSEALWTHGKDQWILKTQGVTHVGRSFAGTSVLRHVNASTLSWESRDRVEGGVLVPDRGPLLAKRRPPPPGE